MSNFTLGVPLIGILASMLLLGNQMSLLFAAGLCLVFSGMVLAAIAAARTKG